MSTTSSQSGNKFPEGIERLVYIRGNRRNEPPEIHRCPECGTYYSIKNVYEWTTIGCDDDDYMTRLTPLEALPLLPESEQKEIQTCWQQLMICLQKCKTSIRNDIAEYARRCSKNDIG